MRASLNKSQKTVVASQRVAAPTLTLPGDAQRQPNQKSTQVKVSPRKYRIWHFEQCFLLWCVSKCSLLARFASNKVFNAVKGRVIDGGALGTEWRSVRWPRPPIPSAAEAVAANKLKMGNATHSNRDDGPVSLALTCATNNSSMQWAIYAFFKFCVARFKIHFLMVNRVGECQHCLWHQLPSDCKQIWFKWDSFFKPVFFSSDCPYCF